MCMLLLSTGSLNTSGSGHTFPASSGWQVSTVDLFTSNFTISTGRSLPGKVESEDDRADEQSETGHYEGVTFIIRVGRVTRLFYTLQCIIPPIILVLIGFTTFLLPKDKFTDRLKTLIGLMFPLCKPSPSSQST